MSVCPTCGQSLPHNYLGLVEVVIAGVKDIIVDRRRPRTKFNCPWCAGDVRVGCIWCKEPDPETSYAERRAAGWSRKMAARVLAASLLTTTALIPVGAHADLVGSNAQVSVSVFGSIERATVYSQSVNPGTTTVDLGAATGGNVPGSVVLNEGASTFGYSYSGNSTQEAVQVSIASGTPAAVLDTQALLAPDGSISFPQLGGTSGAQPADTILYGASSLTGVLTLTCPVPSCSSSQTAQYVVNQLNWTGGSFSDSSPFGVGSPPLTFAVNGAQLQETSAVPYGVSGDLSLYNPDSGLTLNVASCTPTPCDPEFSAQAVPAPVVGHSLIGALMVGMVLGWSELRRRRTSRGMA